MSCVLRLSVRHCVIWTTSFSRKIDVMARQLNMSAWSSNKEDRSKVSANKERITFWFYHMMDEFCCWSHPVSPETAFSRLPHFWDYGWGSKRVHRVSRQQLHVNRRYFPSPSSAWARQVLMFVIRRTQVFVGWITQESFQCPYWLILRGFYFRLIISFVFAIILPVLPPDLIF